MRADWLQVHRGSAPLIVSIPHAGQALMHVEGQVKSSWLARVDTDWWVDQLYSFVDDFDATVIVTKISRTVIDVNRDPDSRSLYPGMATTELVPTTTFDGEPLYDDSSMPNETERTRRRREYYDPYHAAIASEIERLRAMHSSIVLYDAHSIRSRVPRLFQGELPLFNIGTFDGRSCADALAARVAAACGGHSSSFVVNGRFKGGYITRTYGQPTEHVHAIQMELACRAYMDEPSGARTPSSWPPPFSDVRARSAQAALRSVLASCLEFVSTTGGDR